MFEIAKPFLLSLALGLTLGIERERAHRDAAPHAALGARTFALIALLGTLAAHLSSPAVAAVLGAFVAIVVVASYWRTDGTRGGDLGATTEVAAMATFALGWLAHQEPRLAAMIGVVVLAVLWLKPRIHAFAHQGLSDAEVNSALAFLVIALVVLPLLPDRAVDAWGLFNPARLWLLFTIIAGVSFAGYIAVRAVGPTRGLAAAGFAAGLVSSTAATLSLSRRAREEPTFAGPLATGIVLANVASAIAQIVVVWVANPEFLPRAATLVGTPILVGIAGTIGALWWLERHDAARPDATFRLSNPLELRSALLMAGLFSLVLAVSAVASRLLGPRGVIATAALAGTGDVHAATLAAATVYGAGEISEPDALLAILVAFLVNMTVKLSIVGVTGGHRLIAITAPPLVAMAVSAIAAYLLMR